MAKSLDTALGIRRSRRYKVRAVPNGSEDNSTHFAVEGPGIHEFSKMAAVARLLEAALNAAKEFCQDGTRS